MVSFLLVSKGEKTQGSAQRNWFIQFSFLSHVVVLSLRQGSILWRPVDLNSVVDFHPSGKRLASSLPQPEWLISNQEGSPWASPGVVDFEPEGKCLASSLPQPEWLVSNQEGSPWASPGWLISNQKGNVWLQVYPNPSG